MPRLQLIFWLNIVLNIMVLLVTIIAYNFKNISLLILALILFLFLGICYYIICSLGSISSYFCRVLFLFFAFFLLYLFFVFFSFFESFELVELKISLGLRDYDLWLSFFGPINLAKVDIHLKWLLVLRTLLIKVVVAMYIDLDFNSIDCID